MTQKTEVAVEIGVDVQGTGNVKSIKQELRDARAEAVAMARAFGETSPEAANAAAKVAKLNDEIQDLGNRVKALNPDKFERLATLGSGIANGFVAAQGAMALFGTESKDLEKTMVKLQGAIALSQGLQGLKDVREQFTALGSVIKTQVTTAFSTLKGAMSALGIGLLVVALGLLVANFEKVKEAVLKLIPGLAKVGEWITKIVNAVTDWVGITSEATRALDALIEGNKLLNAETERQIKILEASGASSEAIYWKKKELWEREMNELKKKGEVNGKLTEEEQKRQYDLWTEYYVEDAKRKKALTDANAAYLKKLADDKQKAFEAAQKQIIEDDKWNEEHDKQIAKEREEWVKAQNAIAIAEEQALQDEVKRLQAIADAEQKQREADSLESHKRMQDLRVQAVTQGLNTISAIYAAFAGKSEEQQKRLFQVQKAINIATAIIDTYVAAQGAYKSQMALTTPDAPIRAAIAAGVAIAQGLARVAAIKATQYNSPSAPTTSAGVATTAPQLQQSAGQQRQVLTLTGITGSTGIRTSTPPIKVYVTEGDITASQDRVKSLKNRALVQ